MQHHVIHHINGRLRLRLPELSAADDIARLQTELERLPRFKSWRFNPTVRSAVIEYVADVRPAEVGDASSSFIFVEELLARIAIVPVFDHAIDAEPESPIGSTDQADQADQSDRDRATAKPTGDDWEQLATPIASLGLAGLASVIELPIVLTAAAIGLAAWPLIERGLAGLTAANPDDRQLKVELLDTIWLAWQLTQGQFIAPALLAALTEAGIIVRDRTRQEERDEVSTLLDHQRRGQTWVERGDTAVAIPVPAVQIGDVVIVGQAERVPIDGEVVAIAPQTQIAAPSWCEPGRDVEVTIGQRLDAGTLVTRGTLRVRAQRSGNATHATIVRHLADTVTTLHTDFGDRLNVISDAIVAPTLIGAGSLLALGFPQGALPLLQLDFGTGLAVTLPTTALSATIGAARQGIYLRDGQVLERLAGVKIAVFELSSVVIPMTVTEIYPLKSETAPAILISFVASAYQDLEVALRDVVAGYAATIDAAQLTCDRHQVIPGGGIEADILGQTIQIGSEAWLLQGGYSHAAFEALRQRYPDQCQLQLQTHSQTATHREFERLLFVGCDGELLGAVGYGVQICPTAEEAIAMLQSQGITSYLIGDDRAPVIEAIAHHLAIAPECGFAAATPEDRLAIMEALSDRHDLDSRPHRQTKHHRDPRELLWISRDREFEIPLDRRGLFAEIGATLDLSLADRRIDLVAIDGDLRDLPHAIAIAQHAANMAILNAATVIVPNLGVVLTGMLFGFDPVAAVMINQCAVLLAEFNGLQLRRGRSKSHRWPHNHQAAIDPDATLNDRDLEALFSDRRITPSPRSPRRKLPAPDSRDFPQNPQNLAIS